MNEIPFKQNQSDRTIDLESAEQFFNENTRDFTIHEELTQVVSNQRQIPDLKQQAQLHEEVPTTTQNEQTLPVEVEREKKPFQFPFPIQFPKINISKRLTLTSIGILFAIATLSIFLNRPRPTKVTLNKNSWEMNLSRPMVEFSPDYKDWPYVENQFLNPESSEKN